MKKKLTNAVRMTAKKTGSKRSVKKAVQEFAGESAGSSSAEIKETPKQSYGGVIRVVVIDCSGDPAKAASARERLSNLGMSVTDGGSGNVREETLIVSTNHQRARCYTPYGSPVCARNEHQPQGRCRL